MLGVHRACIAGEMAQGGLIFFLVSTPDRVGAIQTRHHLLRWGKGGYMESPPVFLQSGGFCLSTIVLTISLRRLTFESIRKKVSVLKCF